VLHERPSALVSGLCRSIIRTRTSKQFSILTSNVLRERKREGWDTAQKTVSALQAETPQHTPHGPATHRPQKAFSYCSASRVSCSPWPLALARPPPETPRSRSAAAGGRAGTAAWSCGSGAGTRRRAARLGQRRDPHRERPFLEAAATAFERWSVYEKETLDGVSKSISLLINPRAASLKVTSRKKKPKIGGSF